MKLITVGETVRSETSSVYFSARVTIVPLRIPRFSGWFSTAIQVAMLDRQRTLGWTFGLSLYGFGVLVALVK
jgi:hypothetical protein